MGLRTLVVGDVHGCAEELEALVRRARAQRVVLVGDLFTKGPDPEGVWWLIRENRWTSTLGNHDVRLIDAMEGTRPNDTHAHAILASLDAFDGSWRGWLRSLPLFLDVDGYTVVHAGVHPSGSLALTTRANAINLRRWPDDRDLENPFWWQLYFGERRVIFGHDAVRGLTKVEREGVLSLVGLDTGCCYGRELTGFIPSTGEFYAEPARKVWCPPGRGADG